MRRVAVLLVWAFAAAGCGGAEISAIDTCVEIQQALLNMTTDASSDPEAYERDYRQVQEHFKAAESHAPEEIRPELERLNKLMAEVVDIMDDHGWTVADVPKDLQARANDNFQTVGSIVGTRLSRWTSQECGDLDIGI